MPAITPPTSSPVDRFVTRTTAAADHVDKAISIVERVANGDRGAERSLAGTLSAAAEATQGASLVAAKLGAANTAGQMVQATDMLANASIFTRVPTGAKALTPEHEQSVIANMSNSLFDVRDFLRTAATDAPARLESDRAASVRPVKLGRTDPPGEPPMEQAPAAGGESTGPAEAVAAAAAAEAAAQAAAAPPPAA